MKNMFFVINKEKVYAYVVSILTIVTLFFMSHVLNYNIDVSTETSANTVNSDNAYYSENCNANSYTNEYTNTNTNVNTNTNTNIYNK